LQITPLEELESRVQALQAKIKQEDLDGALLVENMDRYYFSGTMQQGFLFIPDAGVPLNMVRRNLDRAQEESRWEQVVPLASLKQIPSYLQEYSRRGLKIMGLELDVLPVNNFNRLQKMLPETRFVDISRSVREVRMVKSDYEISLFRRAAEIADHMFKQVPELLQEGKPEVVLAAELEAILRKSGHQGVGRMRGFNMEMFFGHLFFGPNGALTSFLDSPTGGRGVTPASPQSAGWYPLKPGEPAVVDYGGSFEGYTVDQTRVFSIGPLPPELERAYEVACRIQDEVVSRANPKVSCEELYELAVDVAREENLGDYFMGYKDDQVKYIGHGVGLDYDEFPLLSQGSPHALEPGMVYALEPKFLFPGKGMVGVENTYLVTPDGSARLSLTSDERVAI